MKLLIVATVLSIAFTIAAMAERLTTDAGDPLTTDIPGDYLLTQVDPPPSQNVSTVALCSYPVQKRSLHIIVSHTDTKDGVKALGFAADDILGVLTTRFTLNTTPLPVCVGDMCNVVIPRAQMTAGWNSIFLTAVLKDRKTVARCYSRIERP